MKKTTYAILIMLGLTLLATIAVALWVASLLLM